jgi:hypothetical protein
MLEFSKTILNKVSFDRFLLQKEYKKCLTYLGREEQTELNKWFSDQDFINKLQKRGYHNEGPL